LELDIPNYDKELSEIEDRIKQIEKTSFFMEDVEKQLQNIDVLGFEKEINEIRNNLHDLDSYEKVKQLMEKLNENIKNYKIEFNQLKREFDKLPLDLIDKNKQNDMRRMLYIPQRINQVRKWIRDIQKNIDNRNRICFPQELTQFTDEYLIGTGGFSRVYKVRNIKTDQIVAVKIPIKKDANIGKSFLRELNNWVSLNHRNIVKIYSYNILPVPYIEMEWCDSCLDDVEKPMQLNLAIYYIHEIAKGLNYAHQHNIAHFDLKPQNILLKKDVPKITDWGLSRVLTIHGTTTIGISLPFAAPEQFSTDYGEKDEKTDIWQLGVLLYNLITNNVPFSGTDFAEYSKNVTTTNIKKFFSKDESIEVVAHILKKCLSKKKKNRYKNVKGFIKDIEELM
jgi:tRNA A-37 threonylcarbamoyl transferase component Bud32